MSICNTKREKKQNKKQKTHKGFWGRKLLKYNFKIQGFCHQVLD